MKTFILVQPSVHNCYCNRCASSISSLIIYLHIVIFVDTRVAISSMYYISIHLEWF